MNQEQGNEINLRKVFRSAEQKRKTQINFMELNFVSDTLECKVEAWTIDNFNKGIYEMENSNLPASTQYLKGMKSIQKKLHDDKDSLATLLLLKTEDAQNFKGFTGIDEDTFINEVRQFIFMVFN